MVQFYHVPSGGMHSCAKYAYFSGTCAVDQPVYFIFCWENCLFGSSGIFYVFRIPVLQKSYLGKHTRKIKAQSLQSGDPIFDLECTVLSFALDSTSTSVFGETVWYGSTIFVTGVPKCSILLQIQSSILVYAVFNFVFFFKSGYLWPTKAKVDWPVCGDCCFHSQFFSNIHTLSSNQSKWYFFMEYLLFHWKLHWDSLERSWVNYKLIHYPTDFSNMLSFAFVYMQTGWVYIYKICGAAFLWYLICMLPLPEARIWMKNTFFIYAVHQIMALFLNKMGNLFLGNSMYIGGIMFLIIPVIVTVFSYCVEKILSKYCPVIWKILSGGR